MKTKLSIIVAALSCVLSGTVSAIEIYKDEKTSVSTRGILRLVFESNSSSDEITDGGSRWGFDVKREIGSGWTAGITTEWAMSFENNKNFSVSVVGNDANLAAGDSGDTFSSRLGHLTFTHDHWGKIAVGKQWGVYYDVAGRTDMFNYWGGSAAGVYNFAGDGGLSGTGRAEQALTWRKSFGNFNLGLQYQAQDERVVLNVPECDSALPDGEFADICSLLNGADLGTVGNGYGISLSYQFDNTVWLGFSSNIAELEAGADNEDIFGISRDEDDVVNVFAASYGTFNDGLYAAITYANSEFHEIDNAGNLIDAEGGEIIIRYTMDYGTSVYAGANRLTSDGSENQYEINYELIGADYPFMDNVGVMFFEMRFNDSTNADGSQGNDNNDIAVGVKVNL
ncbi:porin [Thalassotalea maritima]|uniref:porin n=1 Tax=Thalassotalea maritima TaxID=3242416 RepID=UPI003528C57C